MQIAKCGPTTDEIVEFPTLELSDLKGLITVYPRV